MMVGVTAWEVVGITTTIMLGFTGLALLVLWIGIKIGERTGRKVPSARSRKQ
ncbi:MAG: hypothetical protein OXL37_08195 [Chloroflexota bacterium]|nr:hypothetical protein [Chloroflexota bacterium]MDE2958632.1 hypothetical protein [Chloroflexota bacterium]